MCCDGVVGREGFTVRTILSLPDTETLRAIIVFITSRRKKIGVEKFIRKTDSLIPNYNLTFDET